jgi:photosystem II stability/assembly factor-like uncharacterized protein
MSGYLLIATGSGILRFAAGDGSSSPARGLEGRRPTGLSGDPWVRARAWCCTDRGGLLRSDDAGATWFPSGLEGERLMTVAATPARRDLVWAGAEPSAVWRSDDAGSTWRRTADLESLPSSSEWSFPPRPETHHVRWIGCHPVDDGHLWVAVEAGALVRTLDGGRSWMDRVPEGPWDTHELAVHRDLPEGLRVAAGDGYYESPNGGATWTSPMEGLDVGYLRSVAIDPGDPEVVIVSGATGPRSTYVAGRSDGRVYRREKDGRWQRVTDGWPDPPRTIAPLLLAGGTPGELWAADERGVHRSHDGGASWRQVSEYDSTPDHLRGLALAARG